jgi:hypothetical protein
VSLCDKIRSRHQGRMSWNAAGAARRGEQICWRDGKERQAEMEIRRGRGALTRLGLAGTEVRMTVSQQSNSGKRERGGRAG